MYFIYVCRFRPHYVWNISLDVDRLFFGGTDIVISFSQSTETFVLN